MKEFLKTKTVTHNLMSFTGYKIILIFNLLLESPKSYEDLKEYFKNHEYLKESISQDALRIYLNSLRKFGCKIEKVTKNRVTKYYISEHPFQLKLTDEQVKNLIKVYKALIKTIEVSDLLLIDKFFEKIISYIDNETLSNKLIKISPLFGIKSEIIELLLEAVKNKSKITFYYYSVNSGKKIITILSDNLLINNRVLYLTGYNIEHNNFYKFPVSKIIQLVRIEKEEEIDTNIFKVQYEYSKSEDDYFELSNNEKIIEEKGDKVIVEIISKNKFEITQRILSLSPFCKVIAPSEFQQEIIEILNNMKDVYNGK